MNRLARLIVLFRETDTNKLGRWNNKKRAACATLSWMGKQIIVCGINHLNADMRRRHLMTVKR
ncbi:hypothetical protein SAMN04488500_1205 [Sporomusa malonica]|uniref:Uncharacterized protein n=1 Tax=Sporomusa malonica TaxID=112901 RepID=A0A1W2E3X2_9FIRM|nr:hypothetical protein SAMN04488500_1205 [Sporomusa malonica]